MKCKCTIKEKFLGDGCEACNPEKALEYAKLRIDDLESRMREIGDYAHAHSTGPTIPDALWAVRKMSYDMI